MAIKKISMPQALGIPGIAPVGSKATKAGANNIGPNPRFSKSSTIHIGFLEPRIITIYFMRIEREVKR